MFQRTGGRPALFTPKDKPKGRVQGWLTRAGKQRFELARVRVAHLAKVNAKQVSDADVIEFLARGEENALAYWRHAQSTEVVESLGR